MKKFVGIAKVSSKAAGVVVVVVVKECIDL